MSRIMEIVVKVKLMVRADDVADISDIIDEMEYDFSDTTTKADIEDTEIIDWEIIDSK